MTSLQRRLAISLALGFALLPLAGGWAGGGKSADKNLTLTGKVVPLNDLLAKSGVKIDPDSAPYFLAFHSDDGKIYLLIRDAGSRMFFKDAKLLNRPMRLTARLIPNSQILQVINVHSLVNGKLHEVYYWCDICTIKRFEAGICECCGDSMVFREEPYLER